MLYTQFYEVTYNHQALFMHTLKYTRSEFCFLLQGNCKEQTHACRWCERVYILMYAYEAVCTYILTIQRSH